MAKTKPTILAIDDDESILKTYKSVLKNAYNVVTITRASRALELVGDGNFSLILLDLMMPDMDGIEALKRIKEIDHNLEVVMITAVRDVKSAVQAMRLGAYDYISKPFEAEELVAVVEKAMEKHSLVRENMYLRQVLEEKDTYLNLLGKTEIMQRIFETISKISEADSTVLITGKSGTGKELVAHAIHNKSARSHKPFVVVNCAAIPDTLIESDLFGHEKGSFTGAIERKQGKFELADEGTIFLDEIGCMKPPMQSKLLRVLEDNLIQRVGGGKAVQVDVRVIAATNLDLEESIRNREFRDDLYYRLNVLRVHLPPLHERKEDIPLLLNHFLQKFNKECNKKIKCFSREAQARLMAYDWPGNVRELQNVVERVVALSGNKDVIPAEDIPIGSDSRSVIKKHFREAQADFERKYVKQALLEAGGNQTKAAKRLGINRTTLIAKMKQLGVK